ncbi:hypothetical protein BHM03_00048077 [Ensete ventricosum]|nr:hypothetical protein BHM03_00048077 [Ensete ventricosum]
MEAARGPNEQVGGVDPTCVRSAVRPLAPPILASGRLPVSGRPRRRASCPKGAEDEVLCLAADSRSPLNLFRVRIWGFQVVWWLIRPSKSSEFTLSAKSPDLRPSSPSRPNLRICARVHLLGQNLRICARVYPRGQIPGFAPEFTLTAKSPDLRPSSPSRPNLRICARVHLLGQISGFAPEFILAAKSPDLRPSSPSRPNLRICARVHLLGQISGFAPEFTLSAKSSDLRPSSPSRPNLRICARVHLLGQISGFAPEFTFSAKSPDLLPSLPSRPNLRICTRVHLLGLTTWTTSVVEGYDDMIGHKSSKATRYE